MRRIAISTGEPAGIGPDVSLALREGDAAAEHELVLIGDRGLLEARATALGMDFTLTDHDPGSEPRPGLSLFHVPAATEVRAGVLDPANADYVLEILRQAADGCLEGRFDAMVTAPVHKGVINDAGHAFSGHTEFLAERSGASRVVMVLMAGSLRVALATTHLPLSAVPAAISTGRLREVLQVLEGGLRERFGIPHPRIAVLGLNPHAGEGGHLGREEIEVIAPVIRELRGEGLDLEGPLPADTAFTPQHLDRADAVLAMYHDQGLPVLKYAGFGQAVNVTLGLPFVRTSVDHGTALPMAGTGEADPGSMAEAVRAALSMIASTTPSMNPGTPAG